MALQGSLAGFGIAEILQLAGVQQKTGILHVECPDGNAARILMSGGRVMACERDGGARPVQLGQHLVGAGVVTREQLARALKAQKGSERRVGEELVEAGALTGELLTHFVLLQLRERLGEVFAWRQGNWRFEGKPRGFVPVTGPALSAEAALMDGMRMVEEWPLIRARINNHDVIYRVVKQPEEVESEADALERILDDAFSEFSLDDDDAAGPGGLGAHERQVLALIDGSRTVHALVDQSRLGEFETCKALLTLLNGGYIEPVKVKRARLQPGQRTSPIALAGRIAVNLLVLGAIVAGFVFLPGARGDLESNTTEVAREARHRLRSNRIVAVTSALEAYRLEHGLYPPTLQDLLGGGFIAPSLLAASEGLDYVSTGSDFDLR